MKPDEEDVRKIRDEVFSDPFHPSSILFILVNRSLATQPAPLST
jgi:hypothetical protein